MIWALLIAAAAPASVGIVDLAREGGWTQILEVAEVRSHQLPLRAEESLIAAVAARRTGDLSTAEGYYLAAMEAERLSEVAQVELGEVRLLSNPDLAAETVMSLLRRSPTWEIRSASVDVAVQAIEAGVGDKVRREIEASARRQRREQRRLLELALAQRDGPAGRARRVRLLESSRQDEVGMQVARELLAEDGLSIREKWLVARVLYQHALYSEAEPLLDQVLSASSPSGVRMWEVALTRGRCAFRVGRWSEAAEWYGRAIKMCGRRDDRASLHVHRARALELGGELDAALEEARQAVRTKTTDNRRLFLAQLRLRAGQPEMAARGISAMRSRYSKERGELLRALYEISIGDSIAAERRLVTIRRTAWRSYATVLAAELAADRGDWESALDRLESASRILDGYWAEQARGILDGAPSEVVNKWRATIAEGLSGAAERTRRLALIRAAVLETDEDRLEAVRSEVERLRPFDGLDDAPEFRAGIASQLWNLGLEDLARKWNPNGFPTALPSEILWTAERFEAGGQAWRTVRLADHAWRVAGSDLPVRVYPQALASRLFPLPEPALVRRMAADADIPWTVLAGVVREESRWDPTAHSRVGARGLAQLMPRTAAVTAQRLARPEPSPQDLFQPEVSLQLGAAEIGRLLGIFDGFRAPAIAAYNAGEEQARLWLDACGEGCTESRYVSVIAFDATRRYTKDVLWAATMYRSLYEDDSVSDETSSPQVALAPAAASARSLR